VVLSFFSVVSEGQIVNQSLFLSNFELQRQKAKPSGLPDSNVIFFVATKKTKQKKTWRCAGHVWLDITATSMQQKLSDNHATDPA